MPISPAPKPEPAPPKKRGYSSIKPQSHAAKLIALKQLRSRGGFLKRTRKPLPHSNSNKSAKRKLRNREYYASAEWRAKKKAVHERDGYRCTEMIPYRTLEGPLDWRSEQMTRTVTRHLRCPNFGMNINGKQTAKGLVCEEVSYGHRGIPDRIDTCKTRCRDCDRRLTPLERANHAGGFRK